MDKLNLEAEFPHPENISYLNHAAVAPWPVRTAHAVKAFAEENAKLGATHYEGWVATETKLRQQLQQLLNAPAADDIALLKNTSEALSVVAYGISWRKGDNVVISDQEFPSNRIVWESLSEQGVEVRQVPLDSAKTPEDALIENTDGRTRLLAISSIQYASGLRMNLAPLGEYCRQHEILFCVDAIQSVGALSLDVRAISADFIMADGHKWMLGPEGLAVFYCPAASRDMLRLNQYGWHMVEHLNDYDRKTWEIARSARRFECGSANMLGIHALNASLSLLEELGIERIQRLVLANAVYLMDKLGERSDVELLTPRQDGRFGGIVTFRRQGVDMGELFRHLRSNGVICALRGGGIRFSPHFYTRREAMDRALALALD